MFLIWSLSRFSSPQHHTGRPITQITWITNYKLQTTNYKPQAKNYKIQITNHRWSSSQLAIPTKTFCPVIFLLQLRENVLFAAHHVFVPFLNLLLLFGCFLTSKFLWLFYLVLQRREEMSLMSATLCFLFFFATAAARQLPRGTSSGIVCKN